MDVRTSGDADVTVVLLAEGDEPPAALPDAPHAFKKIASAPGWVCVGLGSPCDGERVRMAAGVAVSRVRELGATSVRLRAPRAFAGEAVEGFVMGAYRGYLRWKTKPAEEPDVTLLVVDGDGPGLEQIVEAARIGAEATNRARDLQEAPPNEATPAYLGERARALEGVDVEVIGRAGIEELGMGCFAGVARGSVLEPALIVLRYTPAEARRGVPVLGLVGKAVTWDSGGYSMKTPAGMQGMKYDMSGGAAVIEAVGAIARLGLPVPVVGVVGATDNMVSGDALRVDDVLTAANGITVEVTNTDAEGRLVLADCLLHAVSLGVERIVDIATLTGGVVAALGIHRSGLMANDDAWANAVGAAGAAAGEPSFRLPLFDEYEESLKSRVADTANTHLDRKAAAIVAGVFLRRFVGDVPWAHLDIAGTAEDRGKPYASKGGAGYGVRTLVALARAMSSAG